MNRDRFMDECGVVGVFGHPEAANLVYLGLYALQHRGQESAGIVATDGRKFSSHRGMGRVASVFRKRDLEGLRGPHAIGHVRYSTSGDSSLRNAQPFSFEYRHGGLALCHNGNLVNAGKIRAQLEREGSIFQTTSDTEVLMHLIAKSQAETHEDRLADALHAVRGAFSLLVLVGDRLIAVRDRFGIRPLVLGKLDDAWIVASETCAFDLIGARFVRDLEPGEMLTIHEEGLTSRKLWPDARNRFCVFEYVYFARPDSTLEGINVYAARIRMGKVLAQEAPASADLVCPVPDSGTAAAIGYAQASGIPFGMGLIRNHYVGRTFIEPKQSIRNFGVRLKLNPVREVLAGKRVVLVDDSVVRGTTSRKIVEMVRQAGAREVHLRIASPPTRHSCFYGIDTPTEEELLANRMDIAEMARALGVDSLAFLSLEGLYQALGRARDAHCDACFSGEYPVPPGERTPPQLSLLKLSTREELD